MEFQPEAIYLDEGVRDHAFTRKVLDRFPQVTVHENPQLSHVMNELRQTSADIFGAGKNRLWLSRFPGAFLKKCPGISPGMVCCNYYVINLIKNCVYDCTYCFLQDFLQNNPVLTAYVNLEDLLAELEKMFASQPNHTFRVGTGELTDSLALDDILPYSEMLIPFFNARNNAVLELKTKSDRVHNLLRQKDPSNTIVSWSINPPAIAELEEKGTPSVKRRLEAAGLCADKGYRIGFHFDPVVLYSGWEKDYSELIDAMLQQVRPESIEWISLGGFRYRPNLKRVIKERHRDTRLFTQEHLSGEDGKYRYLRPLRNQAFETLRRMIKDRAQGLNVYLCMETKEIWEGVTGKMPRSDRKLDQFFDL